MKKEEVQNIQVDEGGEVDAVDNTETVTEVHTKDTEGTQLKNDIVVSKERKPAIPINDKGFIAPLDTGQLAGVAKSFLDSKALPKQFTNVAQVVMALQYARQIGFVNRELAALRQMTIINGTLSIWGELPKALAENTGELEYMVEEVWDKDYKPISLENKNVAAEIFVSVCRGKRKGKPEVTKWFTWKEAETAGLVSKTGSLYKIYPRRMMQMRARSLFLKDEFPDALSGIAIAEYDFDSTYQGRELIGPEVKVNKLAAQMDKDFTQPANAQ
jgi:hypothetical protein